MADLSPPGQNSVDAQAEMFRLAERDYSLDIKALAARSPIPASTLKGWRGGTAMPAWAIGALGAAGIPDHLLSLILAPFGRHVTSDDEGDDDLDAAAIDAAEAICAVARARSPSGPGGVAIVPQERAQIIPLLRKSRASAERALRRG